MASGDCPFYASICKVLESPVSDKEKRLRLKKLGVENTLLNAIHLEISEKAAAGDVQAAKYLRDTAMVKPCDKDGADAEMTGFDLTALTDDELRVIAAQAVREK